MFVLLCFKYFFVGQSITIKRLIWYAFAIVPVTINIVDNAANWPMHKR